MLFFVKHQKYMYSVEWIIHVKQLHSVPRTKLIPYHHIPFSLGVLLEENLLSAFILKSLHRITLICFPPEYVCIHHRNIIEG
jgi:hypothetical protein